MDDNYNLSIYYGKARKKFLQAEQPELYASLSDTGTLNQHLIDIDKKAIEMEESLLSQYCYNADITEEFKKRSQMEWVGIMNNILIIVRSIVQRELIFII